MVVDVVAIVGAAVILGRAAMLAIPGIGDRPEELMIAGHAADVFGPLTVRVVHRTLRRSQRGAAHCRFA